MLVRVYRISEPTERNTMMNTGMTRCQILSQNLVHSVASDGSVLVSPLTGNHPNCTENNWIQIAAKKKVGRAVPIIERTLAE